MKIKVLGCSNSWTPRYTSCYMINGNILMDCGADAYKAYMKLNKPLGDIKLFLISHFHADHIFGLNVFLTAIQRNAFGSTKPKIVGGKGVQKMCEFVFEACNLFHHDFSDQIEFIEVEDGDQLSFDGLQITAYKLDHGDVEDFGFILNENGKTFGYTGDTTLIPALYSFIEKCDTCMIDVSRTKTNAKHLGLDDFEKLLKKYPNKKLLATHCDEEVFVDKVLQNNRVEENNIYEI